ncbi:MAG TPA: hypothetical protein PK413_11380 [Thermoanaerobaculia bacterium]|nr:hypothetical protein [Thermoanaerobaculia bacterium]
MSTGAGQSKRTAGLAVLLVALLFAPAARADFLDSYKKGLEAVQKSDWPTAARLMKEAIAGRAEEDDRLTKRLYLKRYLPHFYLGLALAEQGQCEQALTEWAESERQAVVKQFDEYGRLRNGRNRCSDQLNAAAAELDRSLAAARDKVNAAADAKRKSELALTGLAGLVAAADLSQLADRARGAQDLLDQADQQLNVARTQKRPESAASAGALGDQARSQFESLSTEAERLAQAARTAREETQAGLSVVLADAEKRLAAVRGPDPLPPPLARRKSDVQRLIRDGKKLLSGGSAQAVTDLKKRLLDALGQLEAAATPPPTELVSAVQALVTGQYDQVISLLDRPGFASRRITAHAYLLKAAARYQLYLRGGSRDNGLLEAARSDVRSCRGADDSVRPVPAFFSPRFLEFWESESARS